jgi:hypothetical protein
LCTSPTVTKIVGVFYSFFVRPSSASAGLNTVEVSVDIEFEHGRRMIRRVDLSALGSRLYLF